MARVLGLDLGSRSVKAVLFETTMRGFVAKGFYEVARSQEGDRLESLKTAVSELLESNHLHADQVTVALPGPSLATHSISLPFSDPKRIEATVPFEVESQLPFDLSDAVFDYQVVSSKDKKSDLMVGVVRKAEITGMLEALASIKVDPRVVTHAGIVYQNLLTQHPALFSGAETGGAVAILDIGHERTSLAIGQPGVGVELARTFGGGGKDLTRALATEFQTSLPDAGAWKEQHGALGTHVVGPDAERAAGAFVRGLQPLLRELRSSLKAYTARSRRSVSAVYLCGGTALLPGLDEQLTRDLNIPTQRLGLPAENASEIPADKHPLAAQAYALAVRSQLTGARAPRFNLRRGELAFKGDFGYVRDKVGRLVAFGLALVLLFLTSGFVRNSLLARRERRVDATICEVTQRVLGQCQKDYKIAQSMLRGKESPSAALPKLSAVTLLSELTAKMPPDTNVKLEQIVIDMDRVTVKGETDSSKQIDDITAALKGYRCFREVKSGKVEKTKDGQHVNFRLDLQVECPEEAAPPQG